MIDKKISVSEQVANLPVEAQVIFTWGITHADDIGLLQYSHRTLKAMIVPMWDCSIQLFDKYVEAITGQGLWKEIEYEGQKFYLITRFHGHQTLKKDRQPQTLLNITLDKDPKVSWDSVETVVESFGIHLEDTDFHLESEEKGSEEKRRERKKTDTASSDPKKETYGELQKVKLTIEEYQKLIERLGENNTRALIEELDSYIASKGKRYASHYATLLNWARRKFQEHQKEGRNNKPKMI